MSAVKAYPKPLKMRVPKLVEQEQKEFNAATLLTLYTIMQKPIDEAIAKEALLNYDANKLQTIIQGTTVHDADEMALHKHLGLFAKNSGMPWTSKTVAQYLKENAHEMHKRKKGGQRVPTH